MRRLAVFFAIFLTGCNEFKSTLGLDHEGPNEFDSVPLSPLSLPQDFQQTPATERQRTERKVNSASFPFALQKEMSEEARETASTQDEIQTPSKKAGFAQRILLGTVPQQAEVDQRIEPLKEAKPDSGLSQPLAAESTVSSEATIEIHKEEQPFLQGPKAVSRPILREEETPSNWEDQEAVQKNSWTEVSSPLNSKEANLQVLDSEVISLGTVDTAPAQKVMPSTSHQPAVASPLFDQPASVALPRSQSVAQTHARKASPISCPQRMQPIISQKNQPQHRTVFSRLAQPHPFAQPAAATVRSGAPNVGKRSPDTSSPKTEMQPILLRKTKPTKRTKPSLCKKKTQKRRTQRSQKMKSSQAKMKINDKNQKELFSAKRRSDGENLK